MKCTGIGGQTCTRDVHLEHAVVQRHLGHVLDVFSILDALELHQDMVPLAVVHADLKELQRGDLAIPEEHLETQMLISDLKQYADTGHID